MSKHKNLVMAAAGTLMLLLLGTFFAWSLFRVYIVALFPQWGAATLSMTFTLFVVIFCFGSLFAGRFVGKIGPGRLLRWACLLIALGVFSVSMMAKLEGSAALAALYMGYGGLCGFGVGVGYNVVLSEIPRWFPTRPGFISGLLLMGYGLGSLVCGTVISAMADRLGFFTAFLISGLVIAGLLVLLSLLLRLRPPEAKAAGPVSGGLTTSKMLRTAAFWCLFCWGLFTGCVGLMVINSAAVIAVMFGVAATLGLLVSLFNGCGRVVSGLMYDRLGGKSTYVVETVAFVSGALMVAARLSGSATLAFVGMLMAGLSYGCSMAVIAALMRDMFGMEHYASNFAVVTMAGIPSSFLGPYVSGLLQDSSNGDYLTTFIAMIVFALVGFACAVGISLTKKRIPR